MTSAERTGSFHGPPATAARRATSSTTTVAPAAATLSRQGADELSSRTMRGLSGPSSGMPTTPRSASVVPSGSRV